MYVKAKPVSEDFSDMSGGLNTTDTEIAIAKNQVPYSMNAMLGERGFKRVPGFVGLATTAQFTNYLRGMHVYELLDGSEVLLAVSAGKLYSVNVSNGTLTELYDMTGTGEAWFTNAKDKCFVCNGTKMVKVESSILAYQVGIAAPSGCTAAARNDGGSLAEGVYKIYVSYARKAGGANLLYSQGEAVANVTLGAGEDTVRVTIPNSTDPQVNNKVVWMTDAGGTVYYFYGETDNNTSAYLDISSTTNRNTALNYTVDASQNYVPGAAEFIFQFNNQIFYSISNVLYWSLKGTTVYDYERFHTAANGRKATYPAKITGIFSVGEHLYLNTLGGIIRLPYGDPVSKYDIVSRNYFKHPRTIQEYNGYVYGVTLNGFSVFDGNNFFHIQGVPFSYDRDIKPIINSLEQGASTEFSPAGHLHIRSDRTEYHLSFRDTAIAGTIHNRRIVLDIDGVIIVSPKEYKMPWEEWEGGVAYFAETKAHTIYCGQSKSGESLIFKETNTTAADQYVYTKAGVFLSALTNKKMLVRTRHHIEDIVSQVWWNKVHILAMNRKGFTVTCFIDNKAGVSRAQTVTSTAVSTFGGSVFGVATFTVDKPTLRTKALSFKTKGRVVYLEISQEDDDTVFEILSLVLSGTKTITRST